MLAEGWKVPGGMKSAMDWNGLEWTRLYLSILPNLTLTLEMQMKSPFLGFLC